ncbi:hypothetical protein Pan153_52440 [Gimesia panareensis]|uniref:Uncharacterized protein n=1 Tax=Gimesia panareensis TaxID=2527978 RepID=A0A518FW43_9PLAN|nr:hypothetical protein Pan153_52440 [Gimesia panareensis]
MEIILTHNSQNNVNDDPTKPYLENQLNVE